MLRATATFKTGEQIVLLTDPKAAISAVKKAGKMGKARTADFKRLLEVIKGRRDMTVTLGWVKSHIGIEGNERADNMVRAGAAKKSDVLQVTEGGIRQKIKGWRKEARVVNGYGRGSVLSTQD